MDNPDSFSAPKRLWHRTPAARMILWGFLHPATPCPPWKRGKEYDRLRVKSWAPVIDRFVFEDRQARR